MVTQTGTNNFVVVIRLFYTLLCRYIHWNLNLLSFTIKLIFKSKMHSLIRIVCRRCRLRRFSCHGHGHLSITITIYELFELNE